MWHFLACHKVQNDQRWGFDFKQRAHPLCFVSCLGTEDYLSYCQSCLKYFKNLRLYLLGGERMTTLRMLNMVLKIWSVLSVFILCYGILKVFAAVTGEKLVCWVVATLLVFLLLSQGEEKMRASFLAFLMPPPFWPILPACLGSSSYSILPWVRGCGCCSTLHPLLFRMDSFAAGTFGITLLSRD